MNQLTRIWVYLSRLHRSLGFGIQSPTDYAFVRYVINEHWQYYAYQQLDEQDDNWLRRKAWDACISDLPTGGSPP